MLQPSPITPAQTALEALAAFVSEADFTLRAPSVDLVRNALIDTLGCILGGVREPVAESARGVRCPEVTRGAPVLGTARRTEPACAAFLNAVAGHALEFDDWEVPGNTHPSVVMFPALLAASASAPLAGTRLMDAYIAGYEVIARIGEACNFEHYERGWHTTATLAPIGAAAAISRLRRFDRTQTANAMSLAISRAVGYTCQFGADAKALQAGFAAETGVVAAALAGAGLSGQAAVLDAPTGFNALMGHGDTTRFASAFEQLGPSLALEKHGLIFKAYPSCGYTHRVIDCAREIHAQGLGEITNIERIVVRLPDLHADILPFVIPRDAREARFSLPFCTATALLTGDLTLDDLTGERWREPDVVELMQRVDVQPFAPHDPLLNYDPEQPDTVTVQRRDARRCTASTAHPSGAPQNPLSNERLLAKFNRNADTVVCESDPLWRWPDAADVHDLLQTLESTS